MPAQELVEGAELFALQGGRQPLVAFPPDVICELVAELARAVGAKS